ncbi:unnamed protein product [Staurois parvus]|uniref:Uncharacterized protein n=1 Tax=Staurois parvus TaxID=386267 RepID=A0ABN9CJZ9_9NEOB|nr:unnamed protein product [Staurois parvus]
MQGPGRADIVNAGSGREVDIVNAGSGESGHSECGVRGGGYSECGGPGRAGHSECGVRGEQI